MSYIIVGRKKLQSTPSVGRATPDTYPAYWQEQISIHALRGEGDGRDLRKAPPRCNFYPRPPWGGRPLRPVGAFLPIKISIHALRGEGDDEDFVGLLATSDFYPRPPWGGRRPRRGRRTSPIIFLSTPSVGRATGRLQPLRLVESISIHALRGEGDM